MADEAQTDPQPNEAEARTETGEIKDQSPTSLASGSSETQASPEATESKEGSLAAAESKTEEKKETPAKAEVPEKYEFKAPEGYEYSAEGLEKATKAFKEAGLSQEQAQGLMDIYAADLVKAAEEPYNAYQTMREGWRKEVVANTKLGDGQGLKPEVIAEIGRVKDALGPELRAKFNDAMNLTGAGDHPAFVEALVVMSKFITEGKSVTGSPPNSGEKRPSIAQAIYPNLPSAAG